MSMSKANYWLIVLVFIRFEDVSNLLVVSTDDSILRAWHFNGNQFIPVNPVINDEP